MRPHVPRPLRAGLIVILLLTAARPAEAYIGPGAGFAFLSSFFVFLVAILTALLSLLTWPVRLLTRAFRLRRTGIRGKVDRVVIAGLDGLEPELAERYMADGKMPNLESLRRRGTYARLRTTTPAISPVAWSSFMTGSHPSKHNIFDFLSRDCRTYLPRLSSAHVGSASRTLSIGRWRIPFGKPEIRGRRKSVPFWKILGDQGIPSTILRIPITFPAEEFDGHLLCGMCVPDLKGSQGTFTLYSSDHVAVRAREGGTAVPVTVRNGIVETYIPGPEDRLRGISRELRLPVTIRLLQGGSAAQLRVGGQSIRIEKGVFSPWVRLTFHAGLWFRIRCIARFLLRRSDPHFEMYMTPLNLDPERPALPISHPSYYSFYLSKLLGPFVTLGLANDTWALNEEALGEEEFLDLAYRNHEEWERIFFAALERRRKGVVACHFETTDSIQHMFFRYLDPTHPSLAARESRLSAGVIEEAYGRMDEMIGRVMETLGPRDCLVVLSDHGFKPFRRGVNLNTWLLRNGFLCLREGAESGDWMQGVDWSQTRAYAMGLGGIYLNVEGREAQGIVKPGEEQRRIAAEIAASLGELTDAAAGGRRPIRRVFRHEELFAGPYRENAPDLIVGYAEGYRASWDSAKGKIAEAVFEDNLKAWSGDHCIDPDAVPGVLFCSERLEAADAGIWDIAPTVLQALGVVPPKHMDGRSLLRNEG